MFLFFFFFVRFFCVFISLIFRFCVFIFVWVIISFPTVVMGFELKYCNFFYNESWTKSLLFSCQYILVALILLFHCAYWFWYLVHIIVCKIALPFSFMLSLPYFLWIILKCWNPFGSRSRRTANRVSLVKWLRQLVGHLMFYKNIPLVSQFEPACKPILFCYLHKSLSSRDVFHPYPLVQNCNGMKRLSVGGLLMLWFGMGIKPKYAGVY